MEETTYKRVLLKVSGEALAGEKRHGLDFGIISRVCDVIKEAAAMGVQVGVVVGAGNFWRGAKDGGGRMERTRADQMGMLGTVMNCLAVAEVLEQKGVGARVQTAVEMGPVAEGTPGPRRCVTWRRGGWSSSAAAAAIRSFPPIPPPCSGPPRSARM